MKHFFFPFLLLVLTSCKMPELRALNEFAESPYERMMRMERELEDEIRARERKMIADIEKSQRESEQSRRATEAFVRDQIMRYEMDRAARLSAAAVRQAEEITRRFQNNDVPPVPVPSPYPVQSPDPRYPYAH